MGTGWRRAFCTTTSRDRDATVAADAAAAMDHRQQQSPSPSPRSCSRLGFFKSTTAANSSTPNSSTPRQLRCKVNTTNNSSNVDENGGNQTLGDCLVSPNLRCKTNTKSPKSLLLGSNPSSPRSPFSILKNTLRLSKNSSCGVCMQSVKRGQGMAIYTAECSHTFHFPCIAAHLNKQPTLVCPVCTTTWKDVPLLAIHKQQQPIIINPNGPPNLSNKFQDQKKKDRTPTSSPRPYHQHDQITKGSPYADDEPLLTPRANAGVIPIPEANETEVDNDDEIEEFKGFFVNPVSSSADHESLNSGCDVEVRLMPEAAIVSVNRTHETYAIVLRVKAPPPPPAVVPRTQNNGTANFLDPSRRAPIDLVTVLDVSASMGGAKLQMLKRAMRLVISSLGSADRLSIVAFSACPKRMMPLKRMTVQGQRSARRIIDRLVCSQGSCAAEALKKATKVLEDRRERNPVASIMLLSDGQDEQVQETEPNQRPEATNASSTRFAHVEIPVHDFGYGGKSSSYAPEPAENAFAKCVSGLLSVVVQDLRLQLGFASGSDPAEITAVYSCNGRPAVLSSGCVRFGDLYAEEEREVLVELRVPRSVVGPHHVLSVRCCFKDPATQEVIYGGEKALLVPRAQAVRSSAPKIERLRILFIATRAVAESRRLVEHNELSTAQQLLGSARALVMQSSSIWADGYARGLEAELAEVNWRKQYQQRLEQQQEVRRGNERELVGLMVDENGEPLTPTSAWRAAEKLAKVAVMKKSMNRVSDLHGFENARF